MTKAQKLDLSSVEVTPSLYPSKKRKVSREVSERRQKYKRGVRLDQKNVKDKKLKRVLGEREASYDRATLSAARGEILLSSHVGFLEAEDDMEKTYKVSQREISQSTDLNTSKKIFNLDLETFAPYQVAFSRNGRHLVLGGHKGHASVMKWKDFSLTTEVHVQERIRDVTFLHNDTMFAVAQKKYAYIYDNNGIELHCLKNHIFPTRLAFLPYHFLLCSVGKAGFLKYQDTSTGAIVAEHSTRLGPCDVMCQNRHNALIHLGHNNGVVTMWTPNSQNPAVKMLCHKGPVRAVAVDRQGRYMTTAGSDGTLKIWDIRTFQKVQSYYTPRPASCLDISDTNLVAVGAGPHVQIWKDIFSVSKQQSPYMNQSVNGKNVTSVRFCPFEDVLGVGHSTGFSSVVIPGAGEPNFHSWDANPFETKKQRGESEVRMLLEKIQPTMISLDPDFIGKVDAAPQEVKLAERKAEEAENAKPVKDRKRMRGRNKSSKRHKRKQKNIVDERREKVREKVENLKKAAMERKKAAERKSQNLGEVSALERFK